MRSLSVMRLAISVNSSIEIIYGLKNFSLIKILISLVFLKIHFFDVKV